MKAPDTAPPPPRTPLQAVLDFSSSIWTGVALLATLLVYSAVGSAGIWIPKGIDIFSPDGWLQLNVRQWPGMEMTEFEWFHWWPFKALVGLVCLTMVLATVFRIFRPVDWRMGTMRIPLRLPRVTSYGVTTIHAGILVLAAGSVLYFSTKVEGDAPVARREVTARLPGGAVARMIAFPGNSASLGPAESAYKLQVASIDPQWEILSGQDKGKRAYKVSVMVATPQRTFIRELLDGYPMYTEDLIRSAEPGGPPWTRAKKALGTPLVDAGIELALDYAPQEWLYLSTDIAKCWALYLREVPPAGAPGPWVERPIEGLPLYNDYLADLGDVWSAPGMSRPDHLRVEIHPLRAGDPLPGATITATSYLRYAAMEPRRRAGGDVFDPAMTVRLESTDGRGQEHALVALDPAQKMEPGGRMAFEWAPTQEKFDALVREPLLRIKVPAASVALEVPIRRTEQTDKDLPFEPIEGTEYAYRIKMVHDGLQLPSGDVISVAVVEVRAGDRSYVRWVSDDGVRTRDLPVEADPASGHGESLPLDENIVMEYAPGPPLLTIVAGPSAEELRLIVASAGAPPSVRALKVGEPSRLSEMISLTVVRYAPNTLVETKPSIVPPAQRDRDAKVQFSMIQVAVPGVKEPVWLRYHLWPFDSEELAFGRAYWRPQPLDLPDGRRLEMIFSRQRLKLPSPVALDDFVMETNVGGYSGQSLSVRNWTSRVRFQRPDPGGGWGDPLMVSLNDPQEYGGLWYFQAQWDPPEPQRGYAGLNYTVLGVGSRHGVNVMLVGCCMAVAGMIYAFYIKPIIKRKRLLTAAAAAPVRAAAGSSAARELARVAAGREPS
jgi:hypothetical protein